MSAETASEKAHPEELSRAKKEKHTRSNSGSRVKQTPREWSDCELKQQRSLQREQEQRGVANLKGVGQCTERNETDHKCVPVAETASKKHTLRNSDSRCSKPQGSGATVKRKSLTGQ